MANRNGRTDDETLLRTFSGWTITALVGGIPVMLGLLQILWLAKADLQIARAIAFELNLASLLTSGFLVALKAGVFVVCIATYVVVRRLDGRDKLPPNPTLGEWLTGSAFAAVAVLLSTNALSTVAPLAGSAIILLLGRRLVAYFSKHSNAVRRRSADLAATLLVASAAIAAIVLTMRGSWLPTELLATSDGSRRVYVLSTNDNVVSVVDDDGSLERVPVGDVTSLAVCPDGSLAPHGPAARYWHPSLLRLMFGTPPMESPSGCRSG